MDDPGIQAFRYLLCDLLLAEEIIEQLACRAVIRDDMVVGRKILISKMMIYAKGFLRSNKTAL